MVLGQINVQQPQYEDYQPSFDWVQDSESHTLSLMLPGFKKEQLKVQITSTRILRVSGERKTSENKFLRFKKEIPIPNDADSSGIRAKFESGILYIRLPRTNTTTTQSQESPKKPQQQESQEEPKKFYDENKNHQSKDKGKVVEEKLEDVKKDYYGKDNESGEGTSSKGELGNDKNKGIMEKRTPTLELVSRQTQEYKNAVYGLVGEVKKQKKLVNLVVVVLIVLVFVIYVNNAIKSYFGGSKSQEL